MTVHDYLGAIRKQWVVILILALLGAAGGYVYAQSMPSMYRSTSSAYASAAYGESTSELVQGSTYVQNLVQSYALIAKSPYVLQPVINDLDLDMTVAQLARTVTADTPLNTVVVDISVVNSDPELARAIADGIAKSLADAVANISPKDAQQASSVQLTIISPASSPVNPVSPDTRLITGLGAAIGILLGLAWAVLRELVDTRIRSNTDIEAVTDLPLLAEIGRTSRDRRIAQVIRSSPNGITAEAFRSLCMSLAFADVDKPVASMVVTSALPGEGKSSVSVGLAMSLAESSGSVILVDGDLRNPSIAEYTGLDGTVGLTSVLLGNASLTDAVQPWGVPGLDILVAGAVPPNPSQLLASDTMRSTLEVLKAQYDFVVIDTSPIIPVTDPLWLVHETDGAIIVARERRTKRQQLQKALSTLDSVGARVLGVVANDVRHHERTTYYTDDENARPRQGAPAFRSRVKRAAAASTPEPTPETAGER